jgi:hypothetical protein
VSREVDDFLLSPTTTDSAISSLLAGVRDGVEPEVELKTSVGPVSFSPRTTEFKGFAFEELSPAALCDYDPDLP